jgi:hypothetical protein
MVEESPTWTANELHRATVAHANSRADLSRQLASVGRGLMALAALRRTSNEERVRQSQTRVDRLTSWRTTTRERVRLAFK